MKAATYLLALALLAALGALWRTDSALDAERLAHQATKTEHATALASANQKALDDTIKMQRTKDAAIQQAEQRAAQNAAAAAAARRTADGLRNQLADATRRIVDAPPAAVADYATTGNELFADCSRSYQELAGKADGHAADARTLIEAWPVIEEP